MADVKKINGYNIKDATARTDIAKLANVYLIEDIGLSSSVTSTIANMPTAIKNGITTILNGLATNEYITIQNINIQNLISINPRIRVKYKKGDTSPTLQLQGWKVSNDTLMFVDVNSKKIIYYDITNNRPAADNVDDYTSDTTNYIVQIFYDKYKKGL